MQEQLYGLGYLYEVGGHPLVQKDEMEAESCYAKAEEIEPGSRRGAKEKGPRGGSGYCAAPRFDLVSGKRVSQGRGINLRVRRIYRKTIQNRAAMRIYDMRNHESRIRSPLSAESLGDSQLRKGLYR